MAILNALIGQGNAPFLGVVAQGEGNFRPPEQLLHNPVQIAILIFRGNRRRIIGIEGQTGDLIRANRAQKAQRASTGKTTRRICFPHSAFHLLISMGLF